MGSANLATLCSRPSMSLELFGYLLLATGGVLFLLVVLIRRPNVQAGGGSVAVGKTNYGNIQVNTTHAEARNNHSSPWMAWLTALAAVMGIAGSGITVIQWLG